MYLPVPETELLYSSFLGKCFTHKTTSAGGQCMLEHTMHKKFLCVMQVVLKEQDLYSQRFLEFFLELH